MKLQKKELQIKSFIQKYNYNYVILNELELKQVYDFYFNNKEDIVVSSNVLLYYGCYCEIKKDYDNMIKYYSISIEKDNFYAMKNLAIFYEDKNDYDNMMKYFLMGIEKGNSDSMNGLAKYYKEQKDYDNMMKYYLMSIEKGNSEAMNSLGLYYKYQMNYENMMKYYLLSIKKGYSMAMCNLGFYFDEIKDYDNMMKYFLMAFETDNNADAINHIETIDNNIIINYLLKFCDENKKRTKKINKLKNKIIKLQYKP